MVFDFLAIRVTADPLQNKGAFSSWLFEYGLISISNKDYDFK